MVDQAIYVIGSATGPNKIGTTRNVLNRLRAIRAASGLAHQILHQRVVPDEIAAKVERRAHWLAREKRLHGEWFDISAAAAVAVVDQAVKERGEGETAPSGSGRPPLSRSEPTVLTTMRVTRSWQARIEAVAGKNRTAAFIRETVEAELKRREEVRGGRG